MQYLTRWQAEQDLRLVSALPQAAQLSSVREVAMVELVRDMRDVSGKKDRSNVNFPPFLFDGDHRGKFG